MSAPNCKSRFGMAVDERTHGGTTKRWSSKARSSAMGASRAMMPSGRAFVPRAVSPNQPYPYHRKRRSRGERRRGGSKSQDAMR